MVIVFRGKALEDVFSIDFYRILIIDFYSFIVCVFLFGGFRTTVYIWTFSSSQAPLPAACAQRAMEDLQEGLQGAHPQHFGGR